jgi:thiamine biosynthesis lipoprotein
MNPPEYTKRRLINKRDLIAAAIVLLLSAAGLYAPALFSGKGADALTAGIYYGGELIGMVNLKHDSAFEPEQSPAVRIEVKNGAVAFVRSDCPDQLCVNMGWQSSEGGFAACLPNRISLIVEGGPEPEEHYASYRKVYYGLFDTAVMVRIFAKSEAESDFYAGIIYNELQRLHRLFDIYNDYAGINNLKTVNGSAGISPVSVEPEIIGLIELGLEAYENSGGVINIALGSVLRVWSGFRAAGKEVPSAEVLAAANLHTDIGNVIIDREAGTLFLKDPHMSLDVGALAKGYAVGSAMDKVRAAGMISGFINAGGDISAAGRPMDGRNAWNVGVENPFDEHGEYIDIIRAADISVTTSGDYQRFYQIGGVIYHHIIDPRTLMPAWEHISVTVAAADPGTAEMLSTALFILTIDEGKALLATYGAEALWISNGGTIHTTGGYRALSAYYGGG